MSTRQTHLRANADSFTGIEFVQIVDKCDQRVLHVYFITDVNELRPPFSDVGDISIVPQPLEPEAIRIYSPRNEAPDVLLDDSILNLNWFEDAEACRSYLEIVVREPGTYTDYKLLINDDRIDSYFNNLTFSFKVGCYDNLDCAEQPHAAPAPVLTDFPVDYLARDFVSLRNALLDFAAQRYPQWQLHREADVGVMFMEIMAALGDEFSYMQDRMNREAYLETATERRSLRKKSRLMDYEIHDGTMASTVLEFTVNAATTSIAAGNTVWALQAGAQPMAFEVGTGFSDQTSPPKSYVVDQNWNPGMLVVHRFNDETCLEAGATGIHVVNEGASPAFDVVSAALWSEGRALLLRDAVSSAAESEHVHLVRVNAVELSRDTLLGIDIAHIRWADSDALPVALELDDLTLSGNLLPAVAGETRTHEFRLGDLLASDAESVLQAVEREGPLYSNTDPSLLQRNDPCDASADSDSVRPPVYLCSLPDTVEFGLAFADINGDIRATQPEVIVYPEGEPENPWHFQRNLLLCDGDDQVFTIEDGQWGRIADYWRDGEQFVHRDYASGNGYSIRFGDGEFGRLPPADSVMHIKYRLGTGTSANLAAGAVNALSIPNQDPPHTGDLAALVVAVSNPFSITNGKDPETQEQIRQLTPAAWQSSTLFALRPEDYGQQSETLDFVQKAQGSFRWTGTWLSAMTSIDPVDSYTLSEAQRDAVEGLLNCRRQAGRDVIVSNPVYINLDLLVSICISANAFPAHVKVQVMQALFCDGGNSGNSGFFDPDNFTFGSPLRRGALEAAITSVSGVEGVIGIELRIHGATDFEPFTSMEFDVADNELIRLENSPLYPERGSLSLACSGGA